MSKFSEVFSELKAKPQDLVVASAGCEIRTSDDSHNALLRRQAVRAGKKTAEAGIKKPKLGRGLTVKAVNDAIAGAPQPRLVRGKLVRAVNSLRKKTKKTPLTAIELFGDTKRRVGKPPSKKKSAKAG